MSIRFIRRALRAPAFLALLLLLCVAPATRAAETDPEPTADGWRKVLAYARCAFEMFKAITPTDWGAAFFDCGRTFLDEPPTGEKP